MGVSVRKLFTQTFEGHKGRPGEVGGSLPRGTGASGKGAKLSVSDMRSMVPGGEDIRHGRDFADAVGSIVAKDWHPSEKGLQTYRDEDKFPDATKEQVVQSMFRKWTGSSGGPDIDVMIGHVADRNGIENAIEKQPWFDKNAPELKADLESLGDVIYERTQSYFKERGITSVKLYRSGLSDKVNPAFTSWSVNYGGFITTDPNRKTYTADVPVEQIFSLSSTGFGNIVEGEVVVMGAVKSKRVQNSQLFHQTFEGHKGRPGEVGGSLPAGQTSTAVQKHFTEFDYNTPLLELSGEAREALNDYTLGNLEQKRFISKLLKEDYFQQSLQDSLREFAPSGYITIYRGGFEQEGKYANGSLDINKAANYASGYTGFATGMIHEYTVPIENVVGIGSTGEQELFFKLNKKVKKISYENTVVSNSQLGKQLFIQGGEGSGFHGHKGRIGEVGGSRKGGDVTEADLTEMKRVEDFLNAPVDHRKRVENIVRRLGFPVERVKSTEDKGYLFTVGDKQFRAGGEYNPTTGEITMFDVDERSDAQLEGMLAHEVQHSRYRDMRRESQKQFVEVNREVRNKVQKNWPINADGSLKPKFKEKYWAYDIDHTYLSFGSERFKKMIDSDGVSEYSRSYWEKAISTKSSYDFDLAVDETLAEIARFQTGHARPGDYAPAPIWMDLYNEVKKGGGVKKNRLFLFGGQGSGFEGHAGRPGMVGGSKSEGNSSMGKKVRATLFGGDAVEYTMPKYIYHVTSKSAAETIKQKGFASGRKNYFTDAPESMMTFDEEIIGRLGNEELFVVKIDTTKLQNSGGWRFDQEWYPSSENAAEVVRRIESKQEDLFIRTSNTVPSSAIESIYPFKR